MSLREFVRKNRDELTDAIRRRCPTLDSLNDTDRADWVMNDEGLYSWARSEGVRI
jgi:hypothetical protein